MKNEYSWSHEDKATGSLNDADDDATRKFCRPDTVQAVPAAKGARGKGDVNEC